MQHILIMKEVIVMIMLMVLAGCLSSVEMKNDNLYEKVMVDEQWQNDSHQFWNVNPSSQANITVFTFNQTGDVNITVNLTGFFHEPPLWGQGFVNYSIMYNNETVFSYETNSSDNLYLTHNITNVSNNITIEVKASGSDNPADNKPGDFYISQTNIRMWN
jgi:hypothetical protein